MKLLLATCLSILYIGFSSHQSGAYSLSDALSILYIGFDIIDTIAHEVAKKAFNSLHWILVIVAIPVVIPYIVSLSILYIGFQA